MTDGPPADDRSPDHSTCSHCGQPITWDEICYVHDDTGFADCGISGGREIAPGITVNPEITGTRTTTARPVEWTE